MEIARARWDVTEAARTTAGQRPNPSFIGGPSIASNGGIPNPWFMWAMLDIPIETAGKRGKRMQAAMHLSKAAQLGVAAAAWNVRARPRQAMLDLWSATQTEAALQAQADAQREVIRLLEALHDAGEVALTEVARERIALDRTDVALLDARNRRVTARVRLAAAIGVPAAALEGVAISFEEFEQATNKIPDGDARQRALLNRPDVLALLAEYEAAEAALRLEIARQYPDIRPNPGYNYNKGEHRWIFRFNIPLPVLNQTQGPIAEAEARRREVAARFDALQASVIAEIDAALAGYDTARAGLEAAARTVTKLDQQLVRARAAFTAGAESPLPAAVTGVERAAAALVQLDARFKTQAALGQLENALQIPGEVSGFDELTSPPAEPEKKEP